MFINVIILMVFLILSAFFSAAEVSFVSLTNAKIAAMAKRGLPKSKLIKKLKDKPRRLLITILIGNNIVNIAAASLATILAGRVFNSAVLGITTGVMTVLVLVFGEIIPKSYAANHNKKFAIWSAPALRFIQLILYPFVLIFEVVTNIAAGEHKEERVSEEELKALAYAGVRQGTIEHDERAMIERLFALNDLEAEDVMTPRSNIISIKRSLAISASVELIANSAHTRFPVIDNSIDNIVGFVHSRDVLRAIESGKENISVESVIHPIIRVAKDKKLDLLLKEFQRENIHMAAVISSKGKTLGVVTLEDVLEELVGEIEDEHDRL